MRNIVEVLKSESGNEINIYEVKNYKLSIGEMYHVDYKLGNFSDEFESRLVGTTEGQPEYQQETDEVEYSEESDEPKPRYKVKASGEEVEVELDELIKGYQQGTDYTKKSQALAEQRKAIEAERSHLRRCCSQ